MPKKKRGGFIAPASIPRRAFAFLLDMLILEFIVLVPFNMLIKKIIPAENIVDQLAYIQQNPGISSSISAITLLISIFIVFYFTYFEYRIQQTPGKFLTGIYIVPENDVTFWNYLFSNITFIAVFPFILLWIIDPVYMIMSSKNQRLMEKLNNILVVQRYENNR